jgi:hypothetical protein
MKHLFTITLLVFSFFLKSQSQGYRVYFTDKQENLDLLRTPEVFLSEAALIRRSAQGIAVDERDLPISATYIRVLKSIGAQIPAHSKWFNYAYIHGVDPESLLALDFVKRIEYPKQHRSTLAATAGNFDYGFAKAQVELIGGDKLHQRSYTGKGVTIAVIDAGFGGVWQAAVLDSLKQSGRLKGSYSFIRKDTNVYVGNGSHGASVLSVMAALDSGLFVGTAPHANYWLLSSENIGSETPIEMDHWLMAAEFADSVGAHVINTSLGYFTFDDPADDYSYSDMDGNTTIVTKAADMAAAKGLVVVASAGNEGASSWQFIAAPADGDSVLSVGSTDASGNYSSFSSKGPSFDNRVKPDVAGMGSGTVLINAVGTVSSGFGTSFSSPCIAGMAACLIQAQPTRHGQQIANQIRQSGHLYWTPNNNLGYGIPNFDKAYIINIEENQISSDHFSVYPNPSKDKIFIHSSQFQHNELLSIQVLDLSGKVVLTWNKAWQNQAMELFLNDLSKGTYILKVKGAIAYQQKIVLR